jgi:hypothetical protein
MLMPIVVAWQNNHTHQVWFSAFSPLGGEQYFGARCRVRLFQIEEIRAQ